MYPDEYSMTYQFLDSGGSPVTFVAYDVVQDRFVATIAQSHIDQYCGTSLATYAANSLTVTVRGVPSYNTGLSVDTTFTAYFENPRTVACKDSSLIVPDIPVIRYRVGSEPLEYTIPEILDSGSILLGDPTGLNCGARRYIL